MEFYDPTENLLQHFEDLSPVMTLGESGESVFVCVCVCVEREQADKGNYVISFFLVFQ